MSIRASTPDASIISTKLNAAEVTLRGSLSAGSLTPTGIEQADYLTIPMDFDQSELKEEEHCPLQYDVASPHFACPNMDGSVTEDPFSLEREIFLGQQAPGEGTMPSTPMGSLQSEVERVGESMEVFESRLGSHWSPEGGR